MYKWHRASHLRIVITLQERPQCTPYLQNRRQIIVTREVGINVQHTLRDDAWLHSKIVTGKVDIWAAVGSPAGDAAMASRTLRGHIDVSRLQHDRTVETSAWGHAG